jgi:hypothetical protein
LMGALMDTMQDEGDGGAPPSNSPAQVSCGELIRLNRDLLRQAHNTRLHSQRLVLQSSIARIQRCLSAHRRLEWALDIAEWVAGVRSHPPRGNPRDLP